MWIFDLYSSEVREGEVEGSEPKSTKTYSNVVRLATLPWISEPLKEKEIERFHLLPSTTVRGFELLFEKGSTEVLLSSRSPEDLRDYVGILDSVYGELDFTGAPVVPDFLKQVPTIVGLAETTNVPARSLKPTTR